MQRRNVLKGLGLTATSAFYRGEPFRNAFAQAYPRVTFETIDDAGHYSMLETPVRVASIIEKQVAAAG